MNTHPLGAIPPTFVVHLITCANFSWNVNHLLSFKIEGLLPRHNIIILHYIIICILPLSYMLLYEVETLRPASCQPTIDNKLSPEKLRLVAEPPDWRFRLHVGETQLAKIVS